MTSQLIRDHLIAKGVVSNSTSTGWACLIGGLSDNTLVSANQVALFDTQGLPPLGVHGGTGLIQPAFQVLVRGEPNSYAATATKAQAVWDALHFQAVTGLKACMGVNNPIWLQFDEKNRPMWSLNFTTIKQ